MSNVRDDAKMIETPGQWPRWPWLPLKRYLRHMNEMDCAVIHADETGQNNRPIPIYSINLCEVKHFFPTKEMKANARSYPNINALLADGWEVD